MLPAGARRVGRAAGLIVDRYAETLVLQVLSAGVEGWRDEIVPLLAELVQPTAIYERSDVAVRELEGLPERIGLLNGELPSQPLTHPGKRFEIKVELVTAAEEQALPRPARQPTVLPGDRRGQTCSELASPLPAALPPRLWPEERNRCSRSTPRRMRWSGP